MASKDGELRPPLPNDLSLRLELYLERFASWYDAFHRSRSTVNRPIQDAAYVAELPGHFYPHCLQVTTASHHVYKGVAPVLLQALMGWTELATAQKTHPYLRISHRRCPPTSSSPIIQPPRKQAIQTVLYREDIVSLRLRFCSLLIGLNTLLQLRCIFIEIGLSDTSKTHLRYQKGFNNARRILNYES